MAQMFESLVPAMVKLLRNYGVRIQFWPSSVSFADSHPPPITRIKAVRKSVARFRQLQAKAAVAHRKYLERCRLKGRRCECGSGEWAGACCGRLPSFNHTPWRC